MTRLLTLAFLPLLSLAALVSQVKSGQVQPAADSQHASGKASSDSAPSQIFSRARPSVVVIVADDQNSQREALGSGFLVSRDRIATNHHVVEDMKEAYVVFSDGVVKRVSGVVADSVQQDLIILKVETGNRPSLPFGDELSLQQGDPVYALGAPKGLELSFTNGIVSSFRKSDAQFLIQTTAPIAPGSSGGPLFDGAGRVVGVTSSLLADAPGIYFSVGIGDVKRLLRTPQGVALPFDEWAKQQEKMSVSESSKSIASSEDTTRRTSNPSLQETVSWMDNFLKAHGDEWGQPLGRPYEQLQSNVLVGNTDKNTCIIDIRYDSAEPVQLHVDMKMPTKTWNDLVSLADIDPETVKVVARSHVHFETRNNVDMI